MSGPLITDLPLWERHEQRVLTIVRSALHRLRTESPQGDELKLNRELYGCILDVNWENKRSGSDAWFDHPPACDGLNPPTPETQGAESERKRPDLQWMYIDHQAQDARRSVRSFTIECKRLATPRSSGWALNVHYVSAGVDRFADGRWRYGNGVASGAMVGYVESLTTEQIIVGVNGALKKLQMPLLALPSRVDGPLTEMEHSFDRSFDISPFRLIHLWIDIRPRGWRRLVKRLHPDVLMPKE